MLFPVFCSVLCVLNSVLFRNFVHKEITLLFEFETLFGRLCLHWWFLKLPWVQFCFQHSVLFLFSFHFRQVFVKRTWHSLFNEFDFSLGWHYPPLRWPLSSIEMTLSLLKVLFLVKCQSNSYHVVSELWLCATFFLSCWTLWFCFCD